MKPETVALIEERIQKATQTIDGFRQRMETSITYAVQYGADAVTAEEFVKHATDLKEGAGSIEDAQLPDILTKEAERWARAVYNVGKRGPSGSTSEFHNAVEAAERAGQAAYVDLLLDVMKAEGIDAGTMRHVIRMF